MSFELLTPDYILDSVEKNGFTLTGEITQLNSYENRVFDLRLENSEKIIVKFYRPNRWSDFSILEEHKFLGDLDSNGVFVVSPMECNGKTLFKTINQDFYFSIFPKFKGRMPQEFFSDDLKKIGRTLARLHNIGARSSFLHRPTLTTQYYGYDSLDILKDWVFPDVSYRYFNAANEILLFLESELKLHSFLRIHGDCHRGNILNNESEFYFVDFDDCINGPMAQDFWMLLNNEHVDDELDQILSGYDEFRKFDLNQVRLFEPLRGLRIIYYARWIASRWLDPSFPRIFPGFEGYTYWAQETEQLEKIAWGL